MLFALVITRAISIFTPGKQQKIPLTSYCSLSQSTLHHGARVTSRIACLIPTLNAFQNLLLQCSQSVHGALPGCSCLSLWSHLAFAASTLGCSLQPTHYESLKHTAFPPVLPPFHWISVPISPLQRCPQSFSMGSNIPVIICSLIYSVGIYLECPLSQLTQQ